MKGKVARLNTFGAFIELDDIVHGLCHISELSHNRVKDPAEIVRPGDVKEFKIISFDPAQHRLGLSIKALTPAPEGEAGAEEKTETAATKDAGAAEPEKTTDTAET